MEKINGNLRKPARRRHARAMNRFPRGQEYSILNLVLEYAAVEAPREAATKFSRFRRPGKMPGSTGREAHSTRAVATKFSTRVLNLVLEYVQNLLLLDLYY